MQSPGSLYQWIALILGAVISWPALGFVALFIYRETIHSFIERLEVAKFPGLELIAVRRANETAVQKLPEQVLITPPLLNVPNNISGAWNSVVEAARSYLEQAGATGPGGKPLHTPREIEANLPMPERAIFSDLKRASSPTRDRDNAIEQAEREAIFVQTAEHLVSALENRCKQIGSVE